MKEVNEQPSRHPNTDWLRALAILLVLMHHITQNIEVLPSLAHSYFYMGAYGVDLFFVLSGWLVGGLYWREKTKYGKVQITRFWGRRWMRTLPPYFFILPFAYLAVYIFRAEAFDWRYLVFLQNYQPEIPFFLVSWSLAVEEHFYLILPLMMGAMAWLKLPTLGFLITLVVLSAVSRLLDPNGFPGQSFGYALTASHFHFTGLLTGLLLAYIKDFENLFGAI